MAIFWLKNVAMPKMHYIYLKAYDKLVPSDGSICTAVHVHFMQKHCCAVGLILKWKPCRVPWHSYTETAILHGRTARAHW
jgi:hypothetical protein